MDKIQRIIERGGDAIRNHSLSLAAATGSWTTEQRQRYSIFQMWLATVWPGHLSGCAGAVSNTILRRALWLNATCEVGSKVGSTGHVTLARRFCASQGITVPQMAGGAYWPEQARNMARMASVIGEHEDFIAGYTYGSETFAAVMFEVFQPAFDAVGADTTYMREHVVVDSDEHSRMLYEAIESMVRTGANMSEIERGVQASAQSRVEYLEYLQNGTEPNQKER